ncbi:MAG: lactate utilization protein [Clostridia bacterium]|nr:lactate utilization protein [Clostridia bacterium]
MDENSRNIIDIKLKNTATALEKNNFKAYIANTKEEAVEILKTLLKKGDTIGLGGSVTLSELGVVELCRSSEYKLFDRYAPNLSPEMANEAMRNALLADVFITSTNAVTENGELYNVDGRANRVAAMLYGPLSVVVIAGYNKIVKDVEAAEKRVKEIAAPMNCVRLNRETPCTKTGSCMDCKSDGRICADKVIMARQMIKDRVKVILVGEELGY